LVGVPSIFVVLIRVLARVVPTPLAAAAMREGELAAQARLAFRLAILVVIAAEF